MLLRRFLFLLVTMVLLCGPTVPVHATPYAASVDRFEVVGNIPSGSAYDEFDNANLSPEWYVDTGTAVESGGVVTLSSPGTVGSTSNMGGYLVTSEGSEIASSGNSKFKVSDGAGNFVATSTWLSSLLPAENQWYSMQADNDYPDGTQLDFVRIGLFNASPVMADLLGADPGFGFSFGVVGPDPFQTFSINESDITGDILFRLNFDDTTNQFGGAFSLDGGTTFQSPFTSVISSMGGEGVFSDWELNVTSIDIQPVPEPGSILLLGSGLIGLIGLRRKLT